MKSFLEKFSSERIRAQSCNKVQNSVLSLQYQKIEFVFASDVLAFLQSSSGIVFLLGGISFSNFKL